MSSELLKLVTTVQDWHAHKLAHLRAIQESVKTGTSIKVDDTELEMKQRDALFFKLGLEAALAEFEALPFKATITREHEPDDEEGEDE